jgi:2',3'-cyclic-nucleotide 2'-phosphodiesterase (5'-nucleotidase family)
LTLQNQVKKRSLAFELLFNALITLLTKTTSMKSRRSFIAKTTMATTALFATKPFNALAGLSNSFIGYSSKNNHLVFLHVADTELAFSGKTGTYINTVRSKAANSILLHTGKECKSGKFDVQAIADDYQIIQKAGIKTGIIHIAADEINAIDKVNRQARQLKKDENCQMVICISHLQHKSKSDSDNLKLAAMSEYLGYDNWC